MKKPIIYIAFIALCVGLWSCAKIEFDKIVRGEALADFGLAAPVNNASIVLNSATPDDLITMEWSAAQTGVDAPVTYTWIAASKNGGNLDSPLLSFPSDNNGTANKLTVSQKALDEALKSKGIADATKADLIWAVVADNGSKKVRSNQTFNLSVTRFGNGIFNFLLYGPLSSLIPVELDEDTPDEHIKITWQPARSSRADVSVTYKWIAVRKGESFESPLLEIPADNNGTDTTLTLTHKQINDALTDKGMSSAQNIQLDWTVLATAGNFTRTANYTNTLSITTFGTIKQMYLLGTMVGWNAGNALAMIPTRVSGRYVIYTRLSADDEFKFIPTRGSADEYWGDAGNGNASLGAGNFQSPGEGVYRIVFDAKILKYHIQATTIQIVGEAVPDNEGIATTDLVWQDHNQFIGYIELKGDKHYKYVDLKESPAPENTIAQPIEWGQRNGEVLMGDGNNFTTPADDSLYRVFFNPFTKIQKVTKAGMYMIGSATLNGWDDSKATPMTYQTPNKWTVDIDLSAGGEFKFLTARQTPGGNQDATDYGIRDGKVFDGNGELNIAGPAQAGTYRVTFDEANLTYTIVSL